MLVRVHIIPNASKNDVAGKDAGVYKIRLTAPPIEGRANEALIRFLADRLDIAPSRISLTKGHTSKHKTLDILLPSEDVESGLSPTALA